MKKTKNSKHIFFKLLPILFIAFFSCKKDSDKIDPLIENQVTIQEAKAYFENEVMPNSPLTIQADIIRAKISSVEEFYKQNDLLYKEPVWDKAFIKKVNNGTALAIPIHFDVTSFLLTGTNKGIKTDFLNYLLITKSKQGILIAEWVRMFPSAEWVNGDHKTYTGRIIIADWDGNKKKSYSYDKEGKILEYSYGGPKISNGGVISFTSTISTTKTISTKNTVTNVIYDSRVNELGYKDINGRCWENISETPASEGVGVVLTRKEVDCPEPTPEPGGVGSSPSDPYNNGGSGGGGANYPIPNCNPDPNYVVPSTPPPPGMAYILPCNDYQPAPTPVEITITINIPITAKICGNYATAVVGNSFTGQVDGLGFILTETETGEPDLVVPVTLGSICFSIPAYGHTALDASETFKIAYNLALATVRAGVIIGLYQPNSVALRAAMILAVTSNLNIYNSGTSFSTGPCLNSPKTTADYSCN